jgi:hypothetical protein
MAATARSSIITGPARLLMSSASLHTKGDLDVQIIEETIPIETAPYGKIDERAVDAMIKISGTPDGRWSSAIRGILFPYLNPTIGSDIFTASDVPIAIHDQNAHIHTVVAAALTKMPSLTLSPKETMMGDFEFTGIRGTGKAWSDANGLYTVATTGGTLTDAAFTVAAIKTQIYSGIWTGITGFSTAFYTVDGWNIDFDLQVSPVQIDEVGTVKYVLSSVSAMAKCRPLGVTWANIEAAIKTQGSGSRGMSLQSTAADLTITGADASTIIVLKNAALKSAGYKFGNSVVRDGELAWVSTRSFASGVPAAIATMA